MTGPTPSSAHGGGGQNGGGGGGGGGHGGAAQGAFFAARQAATERQLIYYAVGLCGLIGVFVFFHWTRWLLVKVPQSSRAARILGHPILLTSRLVRNVLIRKVIWFKSAGHALTILAFVAIAAAITLTNLDFSSLANWGSRFGWMALSTMALLVFLALKNTPLAFLTAFSYERLNCLHQFAGYTMFFYMVLHAAFYTAFFNNQGRLVEMFGERDQIGGIISGFAFLIAVFSAKFLRSVRYELFYVLHVSGWVVGVIALGVHQPKFASKALIITLIAAGMWVGDRIIRWTRILYNRINNEATLYALPNGGTKIVMKKVPFRAEPGKHAFVWIPAVRKFETHPFTIHKSSPVEFTVKAENGFTRDLHEYAKEHNGASVAVSIDGPYGTFPDPMGYDKILLIAGGGGATFTFGLAVNVLERMTDETRKNIMFVWAVREHGANIGEENLSWFKEQLNTLKTHAHSPNVNVDLYVTRVPSSQSSSEEGSGALSPVSPTMSPVSSMSPIRSSETAAAAAALTEKDLERAVETHVDLEKKDTITTEMNTTMNNMSSQRWEYEQHPLKAGRPDVKSLIRRAVKETPPNQRILVAACGPESLMTVVRDTTAKLIRGDGPGVELHCESFGW
ncbi:putative ferric reductase transmembrane component [Diplogelasinospora grovesii]|uniref:ferric-chelate reductase (NADPH) n=1 Tax=Diplogelasinospora grovesii TaxID=303347 RepID=A0AAN6N1V0_9PEZI|nr:putative ferric reductase transmembrane component [Diplogelasinospora grovesii]